MKPLSQPPSRSLFTLQSRHATSHSYIPIYQCLHTTASKPATPLPVTAHGPPPQAPLPSATASEDRVARRRKQAALLQRGQDLRASQIAPGSAMKKRFWKDVHVREEAEGYQIYLDTRPLRSPTKHLLQIPLSKPSLATAVALEWDLLVSAQQALRHHLIPLTSLVSRALDIQSHDASSPSQPLSKPRQEIIDMCMRYLDTDTLLCWAPERNSHDAAQLEQSGTRTESLREIQKRTAMHVIGYLTTQVWPGVEIKPVLDSGSIIPTAQPQMTKEVIKGWISGLPAFELTGLERAVLAGKSLLVGVRLVMEWSEAFLGANGRGQKRFGIEEAAEAASLEVRWQTGMWGEVEDTHDVEKEDLRRQLGSVILLVGGEGGR
ncbi:MAG: ATP synthase complex assembly protein atp12 [Candelina submexicana]|nr:MAG: ATP synthase complex assembly protein atp12 [Candelina submexicana]